jgi:tetratricopeptide (TPR) repeat protein
MLLNNKMPRFFFKYSIILSLVLIFSISPTIAGQNDTRLNNLFERLRVTQDLAEARGIEGTIWEIWTESENANVNRAMLIGIASMHAGQLGTALNKFNEVIQLAPDFAEGWNKRATIFYLMKKFDRSVNDIAQTLKLEPRHFGALSGLGLINQAIGQNKAAIKAFEHALDLNPHLPGLKEKVTKMKKLEFGRKI